ncbi:hypothetical protein GLAREA_07378 [Glarea lozoyensis ATCC 20868]|uniref:Secreted protein n=2 Tax=Glarea lozoyensis TaxID=101852 RepID=S3D385_GLAL2|nr:uncharacterized protein GLAREA_07378 [Glarea lozoyensis ATCC 20868]EHK97049.1 hypothetical protein M7I_7189 [Glarea lozoyensis 74030]EPE32245.1 hypothetical protein GLAREA_07378 [Glarea lozoyensis ATCC 20868]
MHSSTFLFSLLAASASALPATGMLAKAIMARAPPEANVVINSITYSGAGCPDADVASQVSVDKTVAVFLYDANLVSTADPGTVKCALNLDISVVAGWKYGVGKSIDVAGYASTQVGVQAGVDVKLTTSTGSFTWATPLGTSLAPTEQDVHIHLSRPDSGPWSAPGGGLSTLETAITIDPKSSGNTGVLILDTLTSTLEYKKV